MTSDIVVARLEEVKGVASFWKNEAKVFTPWLAENLDRLGDAIGLELELEGTEVDVGRFSADIVAKDVDSDSVVVIENQFNTSDHDHLGKSITYAAGLKASLIVWITEKATEEHRAAVAWLNENTIEGVGFILCELKLYKIGESDTALHFEILEEPNDYVKKQKAVSAGKKTHRHMPRIADMLEWGVIAPGDILVPRHHPDAEAVLLESGNVSFEGEEMSAYQWLISLYEQYSSVDTYYYTLHKASSRCLKEIRNEYMAAHEEYAHLLDD